MEQEMQIEKMPALPRQILYSKDENKSLKLRVAPYARVSTELEEQESSFENQLAHFEELKAEHADDWIMADMYADRGLSGKNQKRPAFQRMIQECYAGNIDKIITKSVSRFGRNTLDGINTIRNLRDMGIGVYFEREHLDSLDPNSEFIFTIMASLAEEESRSLSNNVRWTVKRKFQQGEMIFTASRFLGYNNGEHGHITVNPEQAETVKRIYREFLDGSTIFEIAKRLTADKVLTACGCEKWSSGNIRSILTNEKYKGDAWLQKTYLPDFLSDKRIKNEGQEVSYYITNHHEAIIDRDQWDIVQKEIRRRETKPEPGTKTRDYTRHSLFGGMIICGNCGEYYTPTNHSYKDAGEMTLWRCMNYKRTEGTCRERWIREKDLKALFVRALNRMASDPAAYMKEINSLTNELRNHNFQKKVLENKLELSTCQENLMKLADCGLRRTDPKKFQADELQLQHRIQALKKQIEDDDYNDYTNELKLKNLQELSDVICKGKIDTFDPEQLKRLVNYIEIEQGGMFAEINFICGLKVREVLIRKVKELKEASEEKEETQIEK